MQFLCNSFKSIYNLFAKFSIRIWQKKLQVYYGKTTSIEILFGGIGLSDQICINLALLSSTFFGIASFQTMTN